MKLTKTHTQSVEMTAEGFFESIYESAFPNFARYVHQSGGMLEDAKDIFHDALVLYYEKCMAGNFEVEKSAEAYIYGIAKHLWLRKTGKRIYDNKIQGTDLVDIPPEPTINERKLLSFLESAGQKCLHLLHGFYYGRMNMQHLAGALGYSTDHSATVQKYKCIEKIRKAIKQKSITYEDFFE